MAKINHDQLFKELLTTFFVEFLELLFPSVLEYLDTDSIQFVDKRYLQLCETSPLGRRKTQGNAHQEGNFY
jgi:hypothetical protein